MARRNTSTAFKMPIVAPSFTVEIDDSSPAPDAGEMMQVLDHKRGPNY